MRVRPLTIYSGSNRGYCTKSGMTPPAIRVSQSQSFRRLRPWRRNPWTDSSDHRYARVSILMRLKRFFFDQRQIYKRRRPLPSHFGTGATRSQFVAMACSSCRNELDRSVNNAALARSVIPAQGHVPGSSSAWVSRVSSRGSISAKRSPCATSPASLSQSIYSSSARRGR